jgi:hypothetical protein
MPYNPGVVDQSGQLFAQGMSKGLESLAEGFEKMREAKQRVIDNGKIADSFVKTNPEVLEQMGTSEEDFKLMAPHDKSLAIQGFMMAQGAAAERAKSRRAVQEQQGLEKFQQLQQGYQNTPEAIRNPDAGAVTRANMLQSGMSPEDMQRQSGALENLGMAQPFSPQPAQDIAGTDYVYAPLSNRGGTAIPKSGFSKTPETESSRARADYYRGANDRLILESKLKEIAGLNKQATEMQSKGSRDPKLGDKLRSLRNQREALEREVSQMRGGSAAKQASPVDRDAADRVKQLYRQNKISKEQALQQLRKLGMQ